MTQLRLGVYRPGSGGVLLPAVGHVLLTPHARRTTAPAEPTDVVVPDTVPVELADGRTADPVVALEPGYWLVRELVRTGASYLVMVPDVPEVVDLADLPWIDPATLEPAPGPQAGWTEALTATQTARDGAVVAQAGAESARDAATLSAAAASGSAASASGSSSSAALSALDAAGSASDAAGAALSAAGSAADAQSARDAAVTARTDAQTARTGAEAAQTAASGSASAAAGSASAATTSATNAAGSATAAATSASDAAATLANVIPYVTRNSALADAGDVADTTTIDAAAAATHTLTLTAPITTIALTGGTDGQPVTLILKQGDPGGHAVIWPADVWWDDVPTLSTTAGVADVITLLYAQGVWYGFVSGLGYRSRALLTDNFTGTNGVRLIDHIPDYSIGTWAADSTNATMTSAITPLTPFINTNRATSSSGAAAAARVPVAQAEMVATIDYDVTGGTGTNDRINLAVAADTATSGLVASIRRNRFSVWLDGVEVHSTLATHTTGTVELGYDGTEGWAVLNGVEMWRAAMTGRTAAYVGLGIGAGAYRYADNLRVVIP